MRSERTNVTVYLVGSTEGKNTQFPTQECADLGADSDIIKAATANLGMYSSEGNTEIATLTRPFLRGRGAAADTLDGFAHN